MAYNLKVMLLDKNSHNLKYKYGNSATLTEITYHQTSNSATALNERNYLNNRTDKVYVSFHYVVDETTAIQCLPLNVNGWHSGDGSGTGNMKSIGIEIARSTSSDVNLRNKAIENGALLIASLMKQYNIPMSKVKSHQSRSGKHCPHDILDRYGEQNFRNLIQQKLNELNGMKPTVTTSDIKVGDKVKVKTTATHYATGQSMSSFVKGSTYEVTKVNGNKLLLSNIVSWVWDYDVEKVSSSNSTFLVRVICDSLNIRKEASFDSIVVGTVKKGGVYTIIEEKNGLGKLKSGAGWISLNSGYVERI